MGPTPRDEHPVVEHEAIDGFVDLGDAVEQSSLREGGLGYAWISAIKPAR